MDCERESFTKGLHTGEEDHHNKTGTKEFRGSAPQQVIVVEENSFPKGGITPRGPDPLHLELGLIIGDEMTTPYQLKPNPLLGLSPPRIKSPISRSMAAASIPSCYLRADQPGALDVPADRSAGALSSRHRRDFVFVVNPKGANGQTGRAWKNLLPYLRTRLGDQCNIHESVTSGPSHAVDITREAIREGADAVIAVGGDGTLHEVVNGFFWAGKPVLALDKGPEHSTTLGLIPLGTGSDFARTFGWKNDPHDAVERIAKGLRLKIDVGAITGKNGEHHFFINEADIHLSAKAGYYASKYKSFGRFCYVLGALRAFMGHSNRDLKVKIDGGDWEVFHKVTALCIGNGKFFGGGMKITPTADPSSGNFEAIILQDFKWYDFVLKLHKLYKGLHLLERNVLSRSGRSIEVVEVTSGGDVYIQSDGEHLGFLPTKCSILPSAIDFFS